MDAPPESDPLPRLVEEMDLIAERVRTQADYKPPTPEQLEDGRRAFEACIERIRAERQALRDFTAFVLRTYVKSGRVLLFKPIARSNASPIGR
jgi:hypothetical protein